MKTSTFIYLNVGILAGIKYLGINGNIGRLYLGAGVIAFLFFFSLMNGRAYLRKRRDSVIELAKIMNVGSTIDAVPECPKPVYKSFRYGTFGSTSGLMCIVALGVAILWFWSGISVL